MKYFLLCVGFICLISCFSDYESLFDCKDNYESGNFGNHITSGTYYAYGYNLLFSKEMYKQDNITSVSFKSTEILEIRPDSSYTNFILDSLGDTLEIQAGLYSVHKTPKNEWTGNKDVYSFVMLQDSVIKKWVWKNSKIELSDSLIVEKPRYANGEMFDNSDSVILDINTSDSCFTLAIENRDDFCRGDYYYTSTRKFCANRTYKDSSIIGVISE